MANSSIQGAEEDLQDKKAESEVRMLSAPERLRGQEEHHNSSDSHRGICSCSKHHVYCAATKLQGIQTG